MVIKNMGDKIVRIENQHYIFSPQKNYTCIYKILHQIYGKNNV